MGFLSTVMDVGQASGPVVTALILTAFGYEGAFQALDLTLFAAALIFLISVRAPSPKAP